MSNNQSIVLVLPYFGRFPGMAPYFFYSCGLNKNLNLLLFTDQECLFSLPENVKLIPFTKDDFSNLVKDKLGIKVSIHYPYKLCDFKPLYAQIFSNYIKDFDFWGYCDMDMIFGDTSKFLTPQVLQIYDVITSRKESLAGNFTIYRNTPELNRLFEKSDIWLDIVKNGWKIYSFPERFKPLGKPTPQNVFLKKLVMYSMRKPLIGKIQDINSILSKNRNIRVGYLNSILSDEYYRNNNDSNWQVAYVNGKLFDHTGKEGMYFHFYRIKNNTVFTKLKTLSSLKLKKILISANQLEIINL